jgi:hypothetical protein
MANLVVLRLFPKCTGQYQEFFLPKLLELVSIRCRLLHHRDAYRLVNSSSQGHAAEPSPLIHCESIFLARNRGRCFLIKQLAALRLALQVPM